ASAVTAGESVTLGYTKPGSGDKLQDAAGNELATLSGQAVTNSTRDTTAPTVTAAVIDGATLTVTFSESMGGAKAADSAWTVSVAGSARSVSSYTLSPAPSPPVRASPSATPSRAAATSSRTPPATSWRPSAARPSPTAPFPWATYRSPRPVR
ncbi:MAG: hypothetical protein ISN29_10535, partial [Gammaproteobacteria bacterium AqS3]|nr:hypothetical protein [Gammaproteobacteria bacterium AqS3]